MLSPDPVLEYGLLCWVMQGIQDVLGLTLQVIAIGRDGVGDRVLVHVEVQGEATADFTGAEDDGLGDRMLPGEVGADSEFVPAVSVHDKNYSFIQYF